MQIIKEINDKIDQIPVVAYPNYLKYMNHSIDYGYVVDGNLILSFYIKKIYCFNFVILPSFDLGVASEDKKRQFVEDCIKYINLNINPDAIMTINTSNYRLIPPQNSYYCKFGTYSIDLTQTEDDIFAKMHSKHRNVVRKAIQNGLTVDYGISYMKDCYNVINGTFNRQNKIGYTYEYFENLMCLNENIDFWVVKDGDIVQGCAVLLWSENFSSYYLHGGSINHPSTGAMNLLHWEAIKKMRERGVKYYDFVGARITTDEGSKLEGIQRFKARFGGPLQEGYMWRIVNHRFRYKLYMFLMKIYMKYIKKYSETSLDIIQEERLKGNF